MTDSGLVSMETSTQSNLDNVINQMASGLKLTEQQNVHIDAKRLSSIVNVFDPLAPPTFDSSAPSVNQSDLSQSPSTGGGANHVSSSSSHGNANNASYNGHNKSPVSKSGASHKSSNYSDQGARPKIIVNSPRLSEGGGRDSGCKSSGGARGSNPTVRFDTSSGNGMDSAITGSGGAEGGEEAASGLGGSGGYSAGVSSVDSSPVRNEVSENYMILSILSCLIIC